MNLAMSENKERTLILWQRVRKGNLKAFETLYKRYFTALCLYAHGLLHDEELAREIVNDVFLKLWNKRIEIDIKTGIKPYLYRCIHNSCVDKLKLKKCINNNQLVEITDKIKDLTGQDEEYILKQISFEYLEKDVTSSIDQLPPRCREIFLLSRFELLSYNEISEKLDISVNTVKTHMTRALDSLRESLGKYLK